VGRVLRLAMSFGGGAGLRGMTDTVAVQTFTVGEGEDLITYDVRGDLADATADRPVLFILGSPMEASYFAPLAGHFADRPVITYDPRGTARNPRGTSPLTPEQHAEDIHRVVEAAGGGPVDVFASSGGAVNSLALVAAHPDDVRRVVAHEPPTAAFLADREQVLAVVKGHGGFLPGDGDPDGFAARLHEVLDRSAG
jgi:pimeloyl-ACP methyl ester carboxylesterase